MLRVANLVKEFTRDGRPFRAVDDVHLHVPPGELVAIVGRSGSGKTTFLNLVAGLLGPTAGSVRVDGVDVPALAEDERSRFRNSRVGYVPQGHSLLSTLSVLDNVRLPHYFDRRDGNAAAGASVLLEELGMAHLAGMYPARLSGGEMRRVAIARALMNKPVLLLADEPTGDLDGDNSRAVMDIFSRLAARGMTVVLSTHEPEAMRRVDRVLEMRAGTMRERALAEV